MQVHVLLVSPNLPNNLFSSHWVAYPSSGGFLGLVCPFFSNHYFTDADARLFRFTFLVFALASVLAYIWATYFVPETANVPLEEIDKLFKAQTGTEERVLHEEVSSFFSFLYETINLWSSLCRVDQAGHRSTSFASRLDG